MSKKYRIFYFLLSEQFFFYLIYFGSTWTLFMLLFFSFPPVRCSLRSRLCWLYLSVELFIFVTRYGKNDVCQFLAYLYYPRETFRITLASLHYPLFRSHPCVPCARIWAATPPLPKSVVLARGADTTVTLLSVRTPDFLLCSFYAFARSESLFALPPRIHPSMSIVPPVLCCLCSKSVPFPYTSKPFY